MPLFSHFEILAENLVPTDFVPPGLQNPFVVQGYWVQISLAPGFNTTRFNIIFQETTDFTQGGGQSTLQAQYVDATGQVQKYTRFFASTGRGFLDQTVSPGKTLIFGVQSIAGLKAADAVPQAGTGWRGTVSIDAQQANSLIATPTQRLVYFNGNDLTKAPVICASVYALPTYSGTLKI